MKVTDVVIFGVDLFIRVRDKTMSNHNESDKIAAAAKASE
jgi:hypothetical protein